MLVKFLSFSATVLGTARYKAIFLSCLALIVSLTSITAIALTQGGSASKDASSAVEQKDEDTDEQQGLSPQVGNRKQSTKEEPKQQATDEGATPPANTPATETTPKPTTTAFDVSLSSSALTLSAESTANITASTSDGSDVAWSVTPENNKGASIVIGQENHGDFSFQVKTDKEVEKGTYQFVVTAKDTSRNINVSKTITVTVQ